ncbi:MAG: holB [Paenibacillaceae bacterium]|jgi:DNA polymerase-3 subunit delta'|nr:holB [Paenibacillaceae bacterium]
MSFQSIPGQARAKRMLQNGLKSGKLSHAYIFSGPAGSGRSQMAVKLAQAVFCTEMVDDACGTCRECRKVEHGNHPNLIRIDPDGASVKIEQIRELQRELGYRASGDQKKIYVISQADRMTIQAANSLLKFLEEPGPDIMAILITENGQALLPTIQSRAQWVPFTPLGVAEMVEALHEQEGHPLALVLPAAHVAGGLDGARNYIQSKEFAEARNVMLQLAKETLTRFPHVLVTVQQLIFKSELAAQLSLILDLWLLCLKDMIHLRSGRRESVVYIDQTDWMYKHAMNLDMHYWVRSMELVIELQKRLRTSANAQLALEQAVIEMQHKG